VLHRPTWPCAKPTELKTFVHQDFHGIHFGTFVGLSNPHISKITNFNFSQNSPPSHLAMPWCTANLGHVQNPPNSTFVHQDYQGIYLGAFRSQSNPHFSKTANFNFSQNFPPSHLAMPWCTAKLGHVQKPTELKTFLHQDFHGVHLGHLETFLTLTSQKPRISFFHKTPHQAI